MHYLFGVPASSCDHTLLAHLGDGYVVGEGGEGGGEGSKMKPCFSLLFFNVRGCYAIYVIVLV